MGKPEISTLSKRITILIGLGVVSAMAFGLSISFYRNLLFEETLVRLKIRNKELRSQIDEGLNELAYYRSLQYRDKYAKENLGRINPGESVLILTRESTFDTPPQESSSRAAMQESAYKQYLQNVPVIEHWKMYLADPEGLEKLKRSF